MRDRAVYCTGINTINVKNCNVKSSQCSDTGHALMNCDVKPCRVTTLIHLV